MTPEQAKSYIDTLPTDSEVIVLLPREMAKKRIEKDGIVSIRVPESTKLLFWDILDRIAAKIGNQKRSEQLDYMLSEVSHSLDNDESQTTQV